MDVRFNVAGKRGEFFVGSDLLFRALAVAENTLCCFLIAPEIGIGRASFERFQAFTVLRGVKDNSERERCAASGLHSGAAGLRGSCVV
jgi:hypothetical protein